MYTDPIADYLTRIRNAVRANHRVVEIPASNLKKDITKIFRITSYNVCYTRLLRLESSLEGIESNLSK